jgi:hypothetical protein
VAAATDPGQGAFLAYAGAARMERLREQALLVNFILSDNSAERSAPTSMFSAEMLSAMASAKAGEKR